jgi:hypothetical protein
MNRKTDGNIFLKKPAILFSWKKATILRSKLSLSTKEYKPIRKKAGNITRVGFGILTVVQSRNQVSWHVTSYL